MVRFTYILIIACILLLSCEKDSNNDNFTDTQLTESLTVLGQGLDFFKMPNSNDYSAIPQDPNNPLTDAKIELVSCYFTKRHLVPKVSFPSPKANIPVLPVTMLLQVFRQVHRRE
ncbi:MAG: hypothetical protein AAGA77_23415 [Bacteroidota bacterium]